MYNQIPLEVFATWPPADITHPESRASLLTGFEIVMMAIITIAVSMRWVSRTYVARSIGPDDWIIIPAAVRE